MSIEQFDLERMLEQQASLFSNRGGGKNGQSIRSFVIADFEYAYDHNRHAGYKIAEGKSAEQSIRWPFHRVAAASWAVARFKPGADEPEIDAPIVLSARAKTELEMVEAFFDALNANGDATVVTWGGECKDFAVLRCCAEREGLVLPKQLADLSPLSRHRLDLCSAVSVRADSPHLPEYATACSIPSKPTPSKDIGKLVERKAWSGVEEQVLADVMTTAVIAIRHLKSQALISCNEEETVSALVVAGLAVQPSSAFLIHTLGGWLRARSASAKLRGAVYRAEPEQVGHHQGLREPTM